MALATTRALMLAPMWSRVSRNVEPVAPSSDLPSAYHWVVVLAGWGDHDMAAWQTFFDKVYELGQIKTAVKAEDVCTNACIGPANDFDHEKVKADALAIELPADLAAVDVEAVQAKLFDQAIA